MGDSIRDLIVSIDFSDIDLSTLIQVDSAIDEIEDQLQQMGHQINDASHEFSEMGIEGILAANALEAALEDVEDAADDAGDEINDMGDQAEIAGIKAGLMGAAFATAFAGIVAAAAPVVLVTTGLASSMGAAAAAAGAYAMVAGPALSGLFATQEKIQKLEDKIAEADSAKERIKLQKELKEVMKGVSKEEKTALKEVDSFGDYMTKLSDSIKPEIFKQFGSFLSIVQKIFKGLEPTIHAVSGVVTKLLDDLNEDISGGGMQKFFDWLASNGAGAIQNFATIGINVLSGLFNIISAFSSEGAIVEESLVGMSEKFKTWSASISQSTGLQNFIEYAKTNGPILWALLGNIWDTVKNLVIDLAPLGTTVLTAITNITSMIVNNWPAIRETIIGVGTAAAAFTVIMKGWQIISAINALMIAFRTGTVAATIAQWGLNAAMLANPITWVIAGIAALIGIGVLLYRHWDVVKAKMGELWATTKERWAAIVSAISSAWNAIKTGISNAWNSVKTKTSETWNKVKTGISNAMETAKQKVSNFFSPLMNFISNAKQKWDEFVAKITSFKMPKIGIPKFLGGNGLVQKADGSHATGLSRVPFDGYRALLHKDEAVLTAKQSDALRAAGILDTSSKRPSLNAGASVTPTGRMKSGTNVFSPSITIQVNGASGDSNDIAKKAAYAAKRELEKLFTQLGLAYE